MRKKLAAILVSALVAMQAGSAMAETRVYIGTPGGQYVEDRGRPAGRPGDRPGFDRGRPGQGGYDRDRGHRPPPPRVVVRERDDFSAGMMGFIGGIAAGSALNNGGSIPVVKQYRENDRYDRYQRYEPRRQLLKPWTGPWYRWCDARYRSFDPRTGTFRDRDGQIRFCEARG